MLGKASALYFTARLKIGMKRHDMGSCCRRVPAIPYLLFYVSVQIVHKLENSKLKKYALVIFKDTPTPSHHRTSGQATFFPAASQ